MASDSLGDEWVYLIDDTTGHNYYANLRTNETCWELPAHLGSGEAGPSYVKLESGWYQYTDEVTGRSYYYNKDTEQTVWSLPEDAGRGAGVAGDADYVSDDESSMAPYQPPGMDQDDDEDDEEDSTQLSRTATLAVESDDEAAARKAKEKAEKRAARRLKILEEIRKTEQGYVDALQILEKVYIVPLRLVADQPKGAIFDHNDLDAVFLNIDIIIKVNKKFLAEMDEEYAKWPDVHVGELIKNAAKSFRGPYTRYVNNYDAAEAHLNKLKASDKEKHRYLDVCKTHPDAKGLEVRSFLIQPVQRVPRYRLLLQELLECTPEAEVDEVNSLQEGLAKIKEVAAHINEDKRDIDDINRLREIAARFTEEEAMARELVRLDRRLLKEGLLTKARLSHRQKRHVFLFNDALLYAAPSGKGLQRKGLVSLADGARVESLPETDAIQHAIALVDSKGKGYTWLAETPAEKKEWFDKIKEAIASNKAVRQSQSATLSLENVAPRTVAQRVEATRAGATLMKYNNRDGKSAPRWVKVWGDKICWGDVKTKECKSEMLLSTATSLLHGAKSSAFFKQQGAKKDQDWLCFSVVFKGRTLDFAATNVQLLLDWYLALAHLIPQSVEPLLGEPELRVRIESML